MKYFSKFDIRISYVFIRTISLLFLRLFLAPRMLNINEKKLNMNENNRKIRLAMKLTFKL